MSAGGGERRLRFGLGDALLLREEGTEEAGDILVLAKLLERLGGYAWAAAVWPPTSISIALGTGVFEPDPAIVAVPELRDFGSPIGKSSVKPSLECDLERRRGFSMSCLAGSEPLSSSSSEDARKRGSLSGSKEHRRESEGKATEATGEDLTMESITQNWMTFIIMGNNPIVLLIVKGD